MATIESHRNPIGSNHLSDDSSGLSRRNWHTTAEGDGHSASRFTDSLLAIAERALDMVSSRVDVAHVLEALCDEIGALDPAAIATVLLVTTDGGGLRPVAGRRAPGAGSDAIAQLAAGLFAGDGAAAQELVAIADMADDASWPETLSANYREIALAHGLRAARLQPIVSSENEVLGVFALCHTEPRSSDDGGFVRLMKIIEKLALIAIEAGQARSAGKGATALHFSEDSETSLRHEEQELRRVIDAVPQHIIIFEPGGTPLYANRTMLNYTGLTLDEMKTTEYRSRIFHQGDFGRLTENRREAFSRSLPFEDEQRILGKDGQFRWFLIRYSPLHGEDGQVVRWYATGTDIDKRRQAEESARNENLALREEIDRCSMFEEIIGSSSSLRRVLAHVDKVARADATVLISGETGTGKELIARAIHRQSARSAKPFIRVNCAAIPPSLIASELFGHEKGAFTGAMQRRLGRFEAAHGGTILLDEVGELPAEAQVALLRVLQEREIERVGSNHPIRVDVRVLAATNRDLEGAVEQGSLRRDLYYRLNVFPIRVPSLRERVDDIPLLVEYLVDRYARKAGKKIRIIAKGALDSLQAYHWPGNIRELQNVVERAVVLCEGESFIIDEAWLKSAGKQAPTDGGTLADSERENSRREREMIESALAESRGQIAGPSGAAARLGIPRQTLDGKIRSLRIDKYRFRSAAVGNQPGNSG